MLDVVGMAHDRLSAAHEDREMRDEHRISAILCHAYCLVTYIAAYVRENPCRMVLCVRTRWFATRCCCQPSTRHHAYRGPTLKRARQSGRHTCRRYDRKSVTSQRMRVPEPSTQWPADRSSARTSRAGSMATCQCQHERGFAVWRVWL